MTAPDLTPEMMAKSGETRFPDILAILLVGCILSTTVVVLRLTMRLQLARQQAPMITRLLLLRYELLIFKTWHCLISYF